jgi:cell division protein FtsW (lipid II flippase)
MVTFLSSLSYFIALSIVSTISSSSIIDDTNPKCSIVWVLAYFSYSFFLFLWWGMSVNSKTERKSDIMEYLYIGLISLFVIALLVVGFVMDEED